MNLWVTEEVLGYRSPVWAIFHQWTERGAQVRKGQKASMVIFYKEFSVDADADADADADDADNADDDGKRRVARASAVFNAKQVDGYELPETAPMLCPIERLAQADSFVSATGADIRHGGDRAYFMPSTDHIQMPEGLFTGTKTMTRTEGYYATLVHELVHWTGAKHRLDRDLGKRLGTESHAAEELGITQEVRPHHSQYLANWLQLLKSDDRAIYTAAARASEAVTLLRT